MSELRINCANPLGLEDILRLLIRDAGCEIPDSGCEYESIESIVKRLVSEAEDGGLALNVCLSQDIARLTPQASPPAPAQEGMIYAGTDHHLYYYNGSSWKQLDN